MGKRVKKEADVKEIKEEVKDVAIEVKDVKKSKKSKKIKEENVTEKENFDPKNESLSENSSKNSDVKKAKKNKKIKHESKDSEKVEESVTDPTSIDNFDIHSIIKDSLIKRGIKTLFPIQTETFNLIYEGNDLVGQARTGTGKTFAFALPVISKMLLNNDELKRGRKPQCMIMAPTRELVSQIANEIETLVDNKLNILTIYGGVDIYKQMDQLYKGVDIIAGTPGRMKDLIDRGKLSLDDISYVILDEVDSMVDMGFKEIVDEILGNVYNDNQKKPQTLLFSATMPDWIKGVVKKYLNQDHKHINLVKEGDAKTSNCVEHLAIQCPKNERPSTIPDIIRVYGGQSEESRTIIFCERKVEADELVSHSLMPTDCHVLHGDVPQDKRELVLKKYREGKYKTLVTTNVAARGIDIPDVDLVIQCQPPNDVEDYIHRSGRTGRAGRKGVCVCFYTPRDKFALQNVERRAKITFKRISAPSKNTIIEAKLSEFEEKIKIIPQTALETLRPFLSRYPEDFFTNEENQLRILALLSDQINEIKPRSVLTAREGFVAFLLDAGNPNAIKFKGYLFNNLKRYVSDEIVEKASHATFVHDHSGIVFDMPCEHVEEIVINWKDGKNINLKVIEDLPELEEEKSSQQFGRNSQGNNKFGNNRFGGNSFYENKNRGQKRKFGGSGFGQSNSKLKRFD